MVSKTISPGFESPVRALKICYMTKAEEKEKSDVGWGKGFDF